MKSETLKTLVSATLAAIAAFLMSGGLKQCGGNGVVAPADQSAQILDLQSKLLNSSDYAAVLLQMLHDAQANPKIVTKYVTVTDRVVVTAPAEADTAVMVLFADEYPYPDSMRLYGGEVTGDSSHCSYAYLVGIQGDSLHFVNIQSNCEQAVQVIVPDYPFPFPELASLPTDLSEGRFMLGAKAGWQPADGHKTLGVHGLWRNAYWSANYGLQTKKWGFEGGFLLPLGRKKQ